MVFRRVGTTIFAPSPKNCILAQKRPFLPKICILSWLVGGCGARAALSIERLPVLCLMMMMKMVKTMFNDQRPVTPAPPDS